MSWWWRILTSNQSRMIGQAKLHILLSVKYLKNKKENKWSSKKKTNKGTVRAWKTTS